MSDILITLDRDQAAQASAPVRIGLDPHYDGVPNDDELREARIQFLMAGVVNRTDASDFMSRSTVFVKNSWRFKELFRVYHRVFHTHITRRTLDCEKGKSCRFCKSETGCPQWLNIFHFPTFCEHYELLLERINMDFDDIEEEDVDPLIEHWYMDIPDEELSILPSSFELVASDFRNGDAVLFMPGTVHWVLKPQKESKRILFKLFFELYGRNDAPTDESGCTLSDGGFKKDARVYESKKFHERQGCGSDPPPVLVAEHFVNLPSFDEVVSALEEDGIFAWSAFEENSPLAEDAARYLEWITGIPADLTKLPFHLTPKEVPGLDRRHVWRDPNNSRTSLFPAGHGNCGLGAFSALGRDLTDRLNPFLGEVVNRMYGMPGRVYEFGLGM